MFFHYGLSFFVRGFLDANLVVTKSKIPSAAQLIIQPWAEWFKRDWRVAQCARWLLAFSTLQRSVITISSKRWWRHLLTCLEWASRVRYSPLPKKHNHGIIMSRASAPVQHFLLSRLAHSYKNCRHPSDMFQYIFQYELSYSLKFKDLVATWHSTKLKWSQSDSGWSPKSWGVFMK